MRQRALAVGLALAAVLLGAFYALAPASATTTPAPTDTGSPSAPATEGTDPAAPAGDTGVRVRALSDGTDVAGVEFTVSLGGTEVADGTTTDSGFVEVAVAEPGSYVIEIDPETLPEGLTATRTSITQDIQAGNFRPAIFPLEGGESDDAAGGGGSNQLAQLAVQGLRFGLIAALAAIGLSMIFGTTGLTNFAHSELITFGALAALVLNRTGLPLLVAAPLAVLLSAGFGLLNDLGLWQPLRRRGTGLVAMMIVSIGLSIVLRYLYLFIFGGQIQRYDQYQAQEGIDFGPFTQRPIDLIVMGISVVVLAAVTIALLTTRIGKATRAVADNPALAAASGINVDAVIRVVWVVGAALAGLAGILLALAQNGAQFQMGFQILLLVFAAVTLGGLGTAFGAVVGALIVGIFIEVSTVWVPAELKNVGALVILIIILLVRPQGLLGRRERVG